MLAGSFVWVVSSGHLLRVFAPLLARAFHTFPFFRPNAQSTFEIEIRECSALEALESSTFPDYPTGEQYEDLERAYGLEPLEVPMLAEVAR